STEANCTSCWVNWLVSSGSSGFWFCSWVVSSVRKVWKFPASVAPLLELIEELPDPAGSGVVPETATVPATASVPAMTASLHLDIHAAVRSEHAAIGPARNGGRDHLVLADHQPLGIAARLIVVVLVVGRRLVAQAELQAAAAGLQAGIVERLLELRRILLQHR